MFVNVIFNEKSRTYLYKYNGEDIKVGDNFFVENAHKGITAVEVVETNVVLDTEPTFEIKELLDANKILDCKILSSDDINLIQEEILKVF